MEYMDDAWFALWRQKVRAERDSTPKCHRGACTSRHQYWWNKMTRHYYCQGCAFQIQQYGGDFMVRVMPGEAPPE